MNIRFGSLNPDFTELLRIEKPKTSHYILTVGEPFEKYMID